MTLGIVREGSGSGQSGDGAVALVSVARMTRPALVLGIGNVLLSDDGAGVRLAERLREEDAATVATVIDGGTLSFSLLTYIESTDSMLVLDAADLDSPPAPSPCSRAQPWTSSWVPRADVPFTKSV